MGWIANRIAQLRTLEHQGLCKGSADDRHGCAV